MVWSVLLGRASALRPRSPSSAVRVLGIVANRAQPEQRQRATVLLACLLNYLKPNPQRQRRVGAIAGPTSTDFNMILGDMSIQGNIKQVRSLVEPLQVATDNGAKRALIPIENKRSFFEVTADVLENVDPVSFGDLRTAAFKALRLN